MWLFQEISPLEKFSSCFTATGGSYHIRPGRGEIGKSGGATRCCRPGPNDLLSWSPGLLMRTKTVYYWSVPRLFLFFLKKKTVILYIYFSPVIISPLHLVIPVVLVVLYFVTEIWSARKKISNVGYRQRAAKNLLCAQSASSVQVAYECCQFSSFPSVEWLSSKAAGCYSTSYYSVLSM